MSDTDNDTSDISEPIEEVKNYPPRKPSFKKAPPPQAEVIPDSLPGEVVEKIRVSLEQDHGFTANTMPTSQEASIRVWAEIVTKTGTFADALKALGE